VKAAFIWFTLVACAVAIGGSPGEERTGNQQSLGLEFRATPKRRMFGPHEKVVFIFQLRNQGKEDVLVSRRFILDRHVLLHILDPTGKEVPWCGKVDGSIVSAKDFAVLRPGGFLSRAVTVSCEERRIGGYQMSASGEYKVLARYYLTEPPEVLKQFAGGARVAKGPITAPQVSFRVGSRPPNL
jgi:hypothetical protein